MSEQPMNLVGVPGDGHMKSGVNPNHQPDPDMEFHVPPGHADLMPGVEASLNVETEERLAQEQEAAEIKQARKQRSSEKSVGKNRPPPAGKRINPARKGRKKGSKNKTTLAREAKQREEQRQTRDQKIAEATLKGAPETPLHITGLPEPEKAEGASAPLGHPEIDWDAPHDWEEHLGGPGDAPETIAARMVKYFEVHDPLRLWRSHLSGGGCSGWYVYTREAQQKFSEELGRRLGEFDTVLVAVQNISQVFDNPLSTIPWKNTLVAILGWQIVCSLDLEE